MFWAHLFVTLLAWMGPFLFSWYLMVVAYTLVQLQFVFLNRCVMNKGHALEEVDDYTFYAFLLEMVGFQPNRKVVKFITRKMIYVGLALVAVLWQVVLGFEPLLFFTKTLEWPF